MSFKYQKLLKNPKDCYTVMHLIGTGAFSKVYLGMHKPTQMAVAIKQIDKAALKSDQLNKRVKHEIQILKKLRDCRIVKLLEVLDLPRQLWLVMEYMGGRDLQNHIQELERLGEPEARVLFREIVSGILACHQYKVLHRDIKLENVLLNENRQLPKICDFGASKVIRRNEKSFGRFGTPVYLAPEVVTDRGYSGFSSDVWSLGVMLYAMLVGDVPFQAENFRVLQQKIVRGTFEIPEYVSPAAAELIHLMLALDPDERIANTDILQHVWLAEEVPCLLMPTIIPYDQINPEIVQKTVELGFPRPLVEKTLSDIKEFNQITVSYWLYLIQAAN